MRSSPELTRRWLEDILENIDLATSFTGRMSFEAFQNDRLRVYGVLRCLEIISEASRRLPEPVKARHPKIQWREIAAAGNIYRHEYEKIEVQAVWTALMDDLPALRAVVLQELTILTPPAA